MNRFNRKNMLQIFIFLQVFLIGYLFIVEKNLKRRLQKFQEKSLHLARKNEMLVYEVLHSFEQAFLPMEFPAVVQNVPFADKERIVLGVHRVKVPGVEAFYNASLIEYGNHYLLMFRHDVPKIGIPNQPFHTKIGCIGLNSHFHPIESDVSWIDLKSNFSEDPRIVKHEEDFFIVYNDLRARGKKRQYRGMHIAKFNPANRSVEYSTFLDKGGFRVEKNWMPFVLQGKGLHFVYSVSPHEIFSLPDPRKGKIEQSFDFSERFVLPDSFWASQWGVPLGGTPPRLINGEYLTFFHSKIKDRKGIVWCFMGAYTFEAKPPFKITRVSPYPILFNGIYDSPYLNTSNHRVKCIYPAGFVEEIRDGKSLLHVSCGENDASVKILTLDTDAFLDNLKPVM